MERWREWLEAHVTRTPKPTGGSGVVPHFDPKPRVVLFDVYGTLLAAKHGDLEHQMRQRLSEESFAETARRFGFSQRAARIWADGFFRAVAEEHERCRTIGIQRPEVLVERIWEDLLRSVPDPPATLPDPLDTAIYRELVANPVCPFQGAGDMLCTLRRHGCALGLASNAQFYTRPILEYIFEAALDDLFDPEWTFFSFELGFAKPDPYFFRLVVTRARRRGLNPEALLVVGNDPVNDMEAARNQGLQAVLFTPGLAASSPNTHWPGPRIDSFDALVQALVGR